ncbi:MAG: hypothetical protein RJB30_222 [Actinomycetota bacterium]|jgi:hydroxyacylglutathione hydrolase
MTLLVDRVIAPYFATNCWILSSGPGSEAIVVDPGIAQPNLVSEIKSKLIEHRLKVVALFITHGHLDHIYSVVPLQEDAGISKVIIHKDDRDLLGAPERAMGEQGLALFRELSRNFGGNLNFEPSGIETVDEGADLTLAGLRFRIQNTPGHTPGSIIATVEESHLITGDTLFAGSIGRTDLPRGSISDMATSLREKIAILPEHLEVLPGHGDRTILGSELRSNPYLLAALEGRLR